MCLKRCLFCDNYSNQHKAFYMDRKHWNLASTNESVSRSVSNQVMEREPWNRYWNSKSVIQKTEPKPIFFRSLLSEPFSLSHSLFRYSILYFWDHFQISSEKPFPKRLLELFLLYFSYQSLSLSLSFEILGINFRSLVPSPFQNLSQINSRCTPVNPNSVHNIILKEHPFPFLLRFDLRF